MMRYFHLQLFLMVFSVLVSSELKAEQEIACSERGTAIIGSYGKNGESTSPLLEIWSEASGNLKKLSINSTVIFYKIEFVFNDEAGKSFFKKEWILKNRATPFFDFVTDFKTQIPQTSKVKVRVYKTKKDSTPYCTETFNVLKVDGEGPKE